MTIFYTEEEFVYPNERQNIDELRVMGDTWSAWKRNTVYVLEYISGELAGRLKQIEITEGEYMQLVKKQVTVEQLLVIHNCF